MPKKTSPKEITVEESLEETKTEPKPKRQYKKHKKSDDYAEKNRELCMIIQGVIPGDGQNAGNELIRINENLINRAIMYVFKRELSEDILEEAFQEASIGIWVAARKFDLYHDNKFSTYAFWWMRQTLTKLQKRMASEFNIPYNLYEKIKREMRLQGVSDISALDFEKIKSKGLRERIQCVIQTYNVVPLDDDNADNRNEGPSMKEKIADTEVNVEETAMENLIHDDLMDAMDRYLDKDERELLKLYYGLTPSGVRLGGVELQRKYGWTAQEVKKNITRAQNKLKAPLKKYRNAFN